MHETYGSQAHLNLHISTEYCAMLCKVSYITSSKHSPIFSKSNSLFVTAKSLPEKCKQNEKGLIHRQKNRRKSVRFNRMLFKFWL